MSKSEQGTLYIPELPQVKSIGELRDILAEEYPHAGFKQVISNKHIKLENLMPVLQRAREHGANNSQSMLRELAINWKGRPSHVFYGDFDDYANPTDREKAIKALNGEQVTTPRKSSKNNNLPKTSRMSKPRNGKVQTVYTDEAISYLEAQIDTLKATQDNMEREGKTFTQEYDNLCHGIADLHSQVTARHSALEARRKALDKVDKDNQNILALEAKIRRAKELIAKAKKFIKTAENVTIPTLRGQLELDCAQIVATRVPKWNSETRQYEGYVGQELVPAEWYGKWEFRTDIAKPEQPQEKWTEADEKKLQGFTNILKQYEEMGAEPDPNALAQWKELNERKARLQK